MNQILSTENTYKPKKNGGNNLIDMRKIIIVFSVLIIIFAIVIVGAIVYGNIREKNDSGEMANLNRPSIKIEPIENKCRITIKYDEGLNKISYWWNDEVERQENSMNGGIDFVRLVEIPIQDHNILHVRATGMDGSVNEVDQEITTQNATEEDPNKPKISLVFNDDDGNITICVTSDRGIKEIKYSWDDDQEIVVDVEQGQTKKEFTIEGKRGTNKIKIKAIDVDGNEQTEEQLTWGIRQPKFDIILNHGNMLSIDLEHDSGFKKVTITINGQQVVYDENYVGYSKEAKHIDVDVEVPNGHLVVDVEAYTLEAPDRAVTWHREADIQV